MADNDIEVVERTDLGMVQPKDDKELDEYVNNIEAEANKVNADIIAGVFDAPVNSIIGLHRQVGRRPTIAMLSPWWANGEFVKFVYLGRI